MFFPCVFQRHQANLLWFQGVNRKRLIQEYWVCEQHQDEGSQPGLVLSCLRSMCPLALAALDSQKHTASFINISHHLDHINKKNKKKDKSGCETSPPAYEALCCWMALWAPWRWNFTRGVRSQSVHWGALIGCVACQVTLEQRDWLHRLPNHCRAAQLAQQAAR